MGVFLGVVGVGDFGDRRPLPRGGGVVMGYVYEKERHEVFREENQPVFLAIRDAVQRLLALAGAFRLGELLGAAKASGDTWVMIACIDRLVEIGEVRELTKKGDVSGQDRIFVGIR